MVLLIDNFDSFTYNLYHYLLLQQLEVQVVRNDKIPLQEIQNQSYEGIVISPGPGRPSAELIQAIECIPDDLPVLGICLGMQALGIVTGLPLVHAPLPVHGKTAQIRHDNLGIFKDIPNPTEVMRYHSLILSPETDAEWLPTAFTEKDELLMGMRHRSKPREGVQFHPESIGTTYGLKMIANWANTLF